MLGFVFFAGSPRNVSIAHAKTFAARARGRAGIVALTVDPEDAFLRGIVEGFAPDMIQLHGSEPTDRVAAIRATFGLPVMKALPVSGRGDLDRVDRYAEVADRILFDARPPKDASRPGGHGVPFDWHLLEDLRLGVPYMLSGGLTPDNVAQALAVTGAPGVDVSSGVERAPGVKDPAKIRAFVKAARAAVRKAA